jgi:ribonucleoside-diphosphate reductase alpha chain
MFDYSEYRATIFLCTQFLDNIVDMNKYPLKKIEDAAMETRRIGLGVMGLADLFSKMAVRYDSEEGYMFMDKLAEYLTYFSMTKSVLIAQEREPFSLFEKSGYVEGVLPVASYDSPNESLDWDSLASVIRESGIRNSYCTTVAPTGSLSMLADTSSGIEPNFALAYEKRVAVGRFFYKDANLQRALALQDLDKEEIWAKISANKGSCQNVEEIPKWIREAFRTSFDINWRDHVRAQAVWQQWINNAISKTINLPNSATVEDIKSAYILAHESGLKGITVYRDGSRHEQVLHA